MVEAGRVTVVVDADTKQLSAGMNKARTEVRSAAFSMKSVAETALGFGVANAAGMAGKAVVQFAKDSISSAMTFQTTFRAFSVMVGSDADYMLQSLKDASHGMISELDAVRNANQAMLLGIDKEALPGMMEIARASALATGQDIEFMFSSLSTGIGRQSRQLLDNLGIIVDSKQAYEDYADSIHSSASALTDAERKIAFTNAALSQGNEKYKDLMDSTNLASEAVQQFQAEWADLKKEAGEVALPAVTVGVKFLREEIDGTTMSMQALKGEAGTTAQMVANFIPSFFPGSAKKAILQGYFEEPTAGGGADITDVQISDDERYKMAIDNVNNIKELEQELNDIMKQKDILNIENLQRIKQLEMDINAEKEAGIVNMGSAFLTVLKQIKSEANTLAEDIRFGSRGQMSFQEFQAKRQQQVEEGLITQSSTY